MKSPTSTIEGSCHCGNLSFELSTQIPVANILARACDCSFCRLHAARNWSDPDGQVTIRIGSERNLQKYLFGFRTADFYICRVCGAYLGAVLSDSDKLWSTINLRLTELNVSEKTASFGLEDTSGRVARRKRVWTPTIIVSDA